MKIIRNDIIPFKGYKCVNLFGILFVREDARIDAAAINQNNSKISTEIEKAKNASTRAKGLFSTESDLKSKWPSPLVGDWPIVGTTVPGTVWQCRTAGTWTNTGQTGGEGEVDLDGYLSCEEITDVTTIL